MFCHSSASPSRRRGDAPTIEGKKIIKLFGWDKPTTAYVREHIEQMEATGLDGVGINLMPVPPIPKELDGEHGNYLWFTDRRHAREQYRQAIRDLQETNFRRFTDNFSLMAMRSMARVPDWFDEDWAVVVENARVHAWVCREAGLVGIMNDVEEAGILDFSPARRKRHSFETYARRVRACAREWMEPAKSPR